MFKPRQDGDDEISEEKREGIPNIYRPQVVFSLKKDQALK